jgi:hypothetical protein
MTLSLLLAQVLESIEGWATEDVARAYSRARDACVVVGDDQRLLQATWGLVAVSAVRGELRRALALSNDTLALARRQRDALFRMAAHTELGGTALVLGQVGAATRHFKLAEALHDLNEHHRSVASFGMDLGIFGRIWATHLMWYRGEPAAAWAHASETLNLAEKMDHPFTRTITLAYAAMLAQFCRNIPDVDRLTEATIAHAVEHGFAYYRAWAEALRAWSLAMQGEDVSVLSEMRRSIHALQTIAGLRLPYYRALLAETCGRYGCHDEGLRVLSEAFDAVRRTEERWWEAELHRIQGELLAKTAKGLHDAEQCFCTAVDVARRQGALVLELRATASLTRLRQQQGRSKEASRALARIHGRFKEGFETTDLREARTLLDELGSKPVS